MEASPAVGATTLLYSTASSSITILRCLRLVVKMIEGTFPHSSLSLSLLVALLRVDGNMLVVMQGIVF